MYRKKYLVIAGIFLLLGCFICQLISNVSEMITTLTGLRILLLIAIISVLGALENKYLRIFCFWVMVVLLLCLSFVSLPYEIFLEIARRAGRIKAIFGLLNIR